MAQDRIETLSVPLSSTSKVRETAQTPQLDSSISLSSLSPADRISPQSALPVSPRAQRPLSPPLTSSTARTPSQSFSMSIRESLPFSNIWQNIAALIASGVAVTTIYYMVRSYSLARWTARKDYLEICGAFEQGVLEKNHTCLLERPPYLAKRWMTFSTFLLPDSEDDNFDYHVIQDLTCIFVGTLISVTIIYVYSVSNLLGSPQASGIKIIYLCIVTFKHRYDVAALLIWILFICCELSVAGQLQGAKELAESLPPELPLGLRVLIVFVELDLWQVFTAVIAITLVRFLVPELRRRRLFDVEKNAEEILLGRMPLSDIALICFGVTLGILPTFSR